MTQMKRNNKVRKAAQKPGQELKTLVILGSVVVLVVLVAVALFKAQQANTILPTVDQTLLVREDSPTRGPADARVTLVEFLDPECEACRAAYPEVEQILKDYEGQLRYVVRYFPNHGNSVLAAIATEAAGEQGMYWEMQETLFANQLEWGEQKTPQTDLIVGYAAKLGLDMEKFIFSLQKPVYLEKAERDRQDALTLGVRGTPTFYVNGQLVYGMNGQMLRNLIDEGLKG